MGEILVARGKRRRSGALGVKERRKTVRDRAFYKFELSFGRLPAAGREFLFVGRMGIRHQNYYFIKDLGKYMLTVFQIIATLLPAKQAV